MNKKHWWKMGVIATNAAPDEIRSKITTKYPTCAFQLGAGYNFAGDTRLPVHYPVEFDMDVYRTRQEANAAWAAFGEVILAAWPATSKNAAYIAAV